MLEVKNGGVMAIPVSQNLRVRRIKAILFLTDVFNGIIKGKQPEAITTK